MQASKAATLVLEAQTAAHAEEMFLVLSDPAIYEYENAAPVSVASLRKRYALLESRRSPDGTQQWLNWVIRLEGAGLIGYVQATVHGDGRAAIAYELASRYWGRGLAYAAVQLMIAELVARHDARTLSAVLKRRNLRSLRLLQRLGFEPSPPELYTRYGMDADEMLMQRGIDPPR